MVRRKTANSKVYTQKKKDIRNIIFKDINEDYAWGKYGDIKVIIMKENGYINATHLVHNTQTKNGRPKEFRQWKLLSTTEDLLSVVSKDVGISTTNLFIVIQTSSNKIAVTRGTYVHPDLIPQIASWASPNFAHTISKIVNKYFSKKADKEQTKLLKKKDDKIDKLNEKVDVLLSNNETLLSKNKKMDKRIKRLLSKNDDLLDQNDEILHKVDIISNDRVVPTTSRRNDHLLVIIKNNDDAEEYAEDEICYGYHALRVMNKSLNTRIANHKSRHPDMEILCEIAYSPNSMNLWNRIKDQLGKGKKRKLTIDHCKFNLRKKYTEEEMIDDIQAIHDERFDS